MDHADIDTPRVKWITLCEAQRKLTAWRVARSGELTGLVQIQPIESVWRDGAARIETATAQRLIAHGVERDVEKQIDRGSFHSWLIRQSALDIVADSAARDGLQARPRDIHPCAATTWMAIGELWSPERLQARVARAIQVRGMLVDHENGVAELDDGALQLAQAFWSDDIAFDAKFEEARAEIERAIVGMRVEAYAADAGRALIAADFASPVWLDAVAGKFVAGPAAMVLTDDWARAAAASSTSLGRMKSFGLTALSKARQRPDKTGKHATLYFTPRGSAVRSRHRPPWSRVSPIWVKLALR